MIFTLYYTYATLIQWWRLRALRNKLKGTLNNQNALLVCSGHNVHDSRKHRSIENLLFTTENRIACTIVPKQKVNLNQWISFPKNLRYFPIYIEDNKILTTPDPVFVLLQAVLDTYTKHPGSIIQVENFGELLGWKASDCFEVIIKTDIEKLTKLIQYFTQDDVDINHELKLLKIETVDIEGSATAIKYEKKYLKEQTLKYSYAPVHWNKFVADIKDLYSKIRDITNPKIKIENGSTKCFEATIHPKPVKKDSKNALEVNKKDTKKGSEDKNTLLDVSSGAGDHRRHKIQNKADKKLKDNVKEPVKAKDSSSKAKEAAPVNKEPSKVKDSKQQATTSNNSTAKIKINKAGVSKKEPVKKSDSASKKNKLVKQSSVKETAEAVVTQNESSKKIFDDKSSKESTSKSCDQSIVTSSDINVKPLNVLVYADSSITLKNVKRLLFSLLSKEKYTIYDFPSCSTDNIWNKSTILFVVCGGVPQNLTSNLIQYLLSGGQLLCICSDLMYSVLHTFTTAEVREHELVRFSYGSWQSVKMMHHIFCYQASPAKKQFSKDSDQSNHSSNGSSPLAPRTPSNVELRFNDKDYNIQVQVLGTEETWQTPSLLLAKVKGSQGRAVFSQVHLEIDPEEYENDEDVDKYRSLLSSNDARLEILQDILSNHLELECEKARSVQYSLGYFLGRFDVKMNLLGNCFAIRNNQMNCDKISVNFCGHNVEPGEVSDIRLPVMIHSCPSNFSTLDYFETLITEDIGRLVIYSDILTSSQHLLCHKLHHGLVIIARQQTHGLGRSNNTWLSPIGCAMFSLQMHIPLKSVLGESLPLIQQLVMVAIVSSIKNKEGYEGLNLGIKWPNDLYVDGAVKIGGIVVNSLISEEAIVNIGCGVNLSNKNPTTCLNDIIAKYNNENGTSLNSISYEKYFAMVFNELERLFLDIQKNGLQRFYDLYYQYWLHRDQEVTIQSDNGDIKKAKVIGIDQYGFLKVTTSDGATISVQPDGNSFDMMRGLIAPKKF